MAGNTVLIINNTKSQKTGTGVVDTCRQKNWSVQECSGRENALNALSHTESDPHVIIFCVGGVTPQNLSIIQELREACEFAEIILSLPNYSDEVDIENEFPELDDFVYEIISEDVSRKKLAGILKRAHRASLTSARLHNYSYAGKQQYHVGAFIGSSEVATELKSMLSRLSEVPLSAMIISGETGTGKGLAARILHYTGLRSNEPLVELNCAALPKELLESQLFGHEAGAFTGAKGRHRGLFEQANGGTLFLDEIGDMDIDLQAKLLKAIEDKKIRRLGSEKEIEVDVQILVATGIDLESSIAEGKFRDDLYHRLSVFHITLPPLRERINDLLELVPVIIAEYNSKANKKIEEIPDKVWEKLLNYDWPGNVRELRNVIERCVLLSDGELFPVKWLQLKEDNIDVEPKNSSMIEGDIVSIPLDGSMALDEMDSFIIQAALEKNNFNVTETARVLGATRETLRYRMQKYKLKKQN